MVCLVETPNISSGSFCDVISSAEPWPIFHCQHHFYYHLQWISDEIPRHVARETIMDDKIRYIVKHEKEVFRAGKTRFIMPSTWAMSTIDLWSMAYYISWITTHCLLLTSTLLMLLKYHQLSAHVDLSSYTLKRRDGSCLVVLKSSWITPSLSNRTTLQAIMLCSATLMKQNSALNVITNLGPTGRYIIAAKILNPMVVLCTQIIISGPYSVQIARTGNKFVRSATKSLKLGKVLLQ